MFLSLNVLVTFLDGFAMLFNYTLLQKKQSDAIAFMSKDTVGFSILEGDGRPSLTLALSTPWRGKWFLPERMKRQYCPVWRCPEAGGHGYTFV